MNKYLCVVWSTKRTNKKYIEMAATVEAHQQLLVDLDRRYSAIEQRINRLSQIGATTEQSCVGGAPLVPNADKRLSVVASYSTGVSSNEELEPCADDTAEVANLRALCKSLQLTTAKFQWVPSCYYEKSLTWRRDVLKSPSIKHLCKSILLENTHGTNEDCNDRNNSRFYVIVFQYIERFDSDKLMRFIRDLNPTLGKKKFNFRLADPTVSQRLTGFGHNAVVPFGGATKIPIVLSSNVAALSSPAYFWMGGGHADCKLRMNVDEFCQVFEPFVADITTPLPEEELKNLVE